MGTKDGSKNNQRAIFILVIVGILILCCITVVVVSAIFSRNLPTITKDDTPPHYGVFVKQNGDLIELTEIEIYHIPREADIENFETITDSRPIIIVWRDDTDLDYLMFYKLGEYYSQHTTLKYDVTPKDNSILEIVPSLELEDGIYCLVQGNPMAAFLPGWCFRIGTDEIKTLPTSSPVALALTQTSQPYSPTRETASDVIQIWKVGSPYEGDTPSNVIPVDIRILAENKGYRVEMDAFPAQGFEQVFFDALMQNREPDILVFNNYGVISGAATDLGKFQGIGTPEVTKRMVFVENSLDFLLHEYGGYGWVVLFTTSQNYEQAKSLAFLSVIKCDDEFASDLQKNQLFQQVVKDVVIAYSGKNKKALGKLSGGKYPTDSLSLTLQKDVATVKNLVICGVWGNERLAFVDTLITFEGPTRLGQKHMLIAVEQNESNDFQLVLISDRVNIIKSLHDNDITILKSEGGGLVEAPELLAPPDNAKGKRFNNLELKWTDTGISTTAYLIESQYGWWGQDGSIGWSGSQFDYVSTKLSNGQTISITAPFSAGAQPHRWRVWAIDKSGVFFFSEWRIYTFTN